MISLFFTPSFVSFFSTDANKESQFIKDTKELGGKFRHNDQRRFPMYSIGNYENLFSKLPTVKIGVSLPFKQQRRERVFTLVAEKKHCVYDEFRISGLEASILNPLVTVGDLRYHYPSALIDKDYSKDLFVVVLSKESVNSKYPESFLVLYYPDKFIHKSYILNSFASKNKELMNELDYFFKSGGLTEVQLENVNNILKGK